MGDSSKAGHWWQTLPGMVTAVAAMLTAITGLVVALHQMGVFESERVAPVEAAPAGAADSRRSPDAGTTRDASRTLPAGGMARAGDALYEVRAARVEPVGTGMLELRLTVRMTNRGRFPAVFSSSVFRLLADGTAMAPMGETTSEAVDGNSTKDGLVVFVFPDTTRDVVLQVGEVGKVTNTIPLALRDGR